MRYISERSRAVAGALAVTAALSAAAGRADAQPPPHGEPIPPTAPSLEAPTAHFDWSVPERYHLGWDAWSDSGAEYSDGYVDPGRWQLMIDACRSSGGGESIVDYDILVDGVGFDFRNRTRGAGCRRRLDNLRRLGNYDVTVIVRTQRGASLPRTERIELRDHLVVSLGDSMASGEGVPDTPGEYTLRGNPQKTVATLARLYNGQVQLDTVKGAEWKDRRCHRSARAGHALAALALERSDPRSSVTYVSLACSGAKVAHLIDADYAGIQPPPGAAKLPPQLEALRDLVGGSGRRVDALLMAIGVNDLGFAGIVQSCAMNWNGAHASGNPDCVYDAGVSPKLEPGGELEQSYARLGSALRDSLDVAEVYITDYPAAPFGQSRGGCGLLGIPGFGIAPREAQAMYTAGLQLYWAVGRAAADQGWNWVPGMTAAFEGHDYCAADPRLVQLETSLLEQGTIHGAVHPTRAGQAALGDLLQRSVVFRSRFPHWHAKLVVEQVRVTNSTLRREPGQPTDDTGEPPPAPPPSDRYAFDFSVRTIPNWPAGRLRFTIPKTSIGEWIAVAAAAGTFELDVYDAPRPPRLPTSVDFLAYGPKGTVSASYAQAQGFGVGCHELAHLNGWAIRYRIEVTRVGGPIGPPPEVLPPCRQQIET